MILTLLTSCEASYSSCDSFKSKHAKNFVVLQVCSAKHGAGDQYAVQRINQKAVQYVLNSFGSASTQWGQYIV